MNFSLVLSPLCIQYELMIEYKNNKWIVVNAHYKNYNSGAVSFGLNPITRLKRAKNEDGALNSKFYYHYY